jgi:hypothetical protein
VDEWEWEDIDLQEYVARTNKNDAYIHRLLFPNEKS